MPVKSFNNTFVDLASGDRLSITQKKSILDQYNSNITPVSSQLGYVPSLGIVIPSAVSNKELIDKVIVKGIGARSLTGTVTSSAGTSIFTYVSGGSVSNQTITVTGLPFKPTFIYVFRNIGGANTNIETITYNELSGDMYPKTIKAVYSFTTANNTSTSSFHYKGDVAPASITNGSFVLPVGGGSASYTWFAIG